mgnify:CR=1 FL=1
MVLEDVGQVKYDGEYCANPFARIGFLPHTFTFFARIAYHGSFYVNCLLFAIVGLS